MSQMYDQDNRDVSLMAIDQYMRWVRGILPMSQEEEQCLLACVEQGRCEQGKLEPDRQVLEEAKQAHGRLVERFQRLVIHIAKKYRHRVRSVSVEWMDLIQEGNVGLLQALDGWSERRTGDNFAGFVGASIGYAMLAMLYSRDRSVRFPAWVEQALARMDYVSSRLVVSLGREPSLEELAEALSLEREKVQRLLAWREQGEVESLHRFFEGEEEPEERLDFVQLFEGSVRAEDARQAQLAEMVRQVVEATLSTNEREVVRLRYGLDGQCHKQREAAAVLGMRSNSIQRIEYRARKRLREQLEPVYGTSQEDLSA